MSKKPSKKQQTVPAWVCPNCVARSTKPTCPGCGLREADARRPVRLWRVVLGVVAFAKYTGESTKAVASWPMPRKAGARHW